jgi:hypothetical protein
MELTPGIAARSSERRGRRANGERRRSPHVSETTKRPMHSAGGLAVGSLSPRHRSSNGRTYSHPADAARWRCRFPFGPLPRSALSHATVGRRGFACAKVTRRSTLARLGSCCPGTAGVRLRIAPIGGYLGLIIAARERRLRTPEHLAHLGVNSSLRSAEDAYSDIL